MPMKRSIRNDHGIYIQIDGIDGSGKSTLSNSAIRFFAQKSKKILDTVERSKKYLTPPSQKQLEDIDILLTAEPTHSLTGYVIRQAIIKSGSNYNARLTAQAYGLDRAFQIREIIQPFLNAKPNRWVIQDRGLISSTAYQTLQSEQNENEEALTVDEICAMEGNRIALECPPDYFIFLDLDPRIAEQRLSNRTEKEDDAIFEKTDFQTQLAKRFLREDVLKPYKDAGVECIVLNGDQTREEISEAFTNILIQIEKDHFSTQE